MSFLRYRRPTCRSPAELSTCLERGEIGLDGYSVCSNQKQVSLKFLFTLCLVAALIILPCLFQNSLVDARQSALAEARSHMAASSPCVHFQTDTMKIIALPKTRLVMSSPRIVSVSAEMVRTTETLDIAECPNKKIRRERHTEVVMEYVTVENWPWGSARSVSLSDAIAVCVQHADDHFAGRIGCEME
jgi:hypothetical protein